jgi:hypothetical protein
MRIVGIALVLLSIDVGVSATVAHASGGECSNEQLRSGYASSLPDCRAYEQVSPVDKNLNDAVSGPTAGQVLSSPSGTAVTFYSLSPFPGISGSSAFPLYLAARGDNEWAFQGLEPAADPDSSIRIVGLSEDLSQAVLEVFPSSPVPAPGAPSGQINMYVRSSDTEAFQLLAPTPSGNSYFADATPDGSHILLESSEELLPGATLGEPNLYEWVDGQLTLVAAHAVAGPSNSFEPNHPGNQQKEYYKQNTISEDGSRIFFTGPGSRIYMREPQAERTIEVSPGPAYWRASTPSGSYVFYIEEEKLYRFDVESQERELLTEGKAPRVVGTFGVSNDGSYAYFVAKDVLANGAVEGGNNIYEWHEGVIVFIADLGTGRIDESNWEGFANIQSGPSGEKSSRVTPNGTALLFISETRLTGYDNQGHAELYLFHATQPVSPGNPLCVSCNPHRIPATSDTQLAGENEITGASNNEIYPYLTRNLSDDGNRVFFETKEALVPQDTNSKTDVYEWENDHLYLISTGQSSSGSFFGDASADGSSVFFLTRQSLVGQDQDENVDLYDAREDGGIAAQSPPAPSPCESETCRAPQGPPPAFGIPYSATFAEPGNIAPPASQPIVKPKPKPLTQVQKLTKALKTCKKKPKRQRSGCEKQARKRYGRGRRK